MADTPGGQSAGERCTTWHPFTEESDHEHVSSYCVWRHPGRRLAAGRWQGDPVGEGLRLAHGLVDRAIDCPVDHASFLKPCAGLVDAD
jgi:hypothetical protein